METREYIVYKFDELPDEAQQKAIDNHRDFNVEHEWWDFIYEYAARAGLEITEFGYPHIVILGKLTMSARDSIRAIWKDHGKRCKMYKTACAYWRELRACKTKDDGESITEDYRHMLCEDYRIMLDQEYEWLTSDEQIAESLRTNEYDFTEDGNID